MKSPKRIAIDVMGGEGGIKRTVPASISVLQNSVDLELVLVGDENLIRPWLAPANQAIRARISIHHTESVIADTDKPADVIRGDKNSSIYVATDLVRAGSAQAMVSAGNTGALLMAGRHLLKTIPGIQKPAIVATIPGISKMIYLLDVGANPHCDSHQLFEFAVMGSVLAQSLSKQPVKVGLLNIGSEQHKGTGDVQEAAELLQACPSIDYIGFVEANELYQGVADVVVCDGFVGNVTIKSSAGVANVVKGLIQNSAPKSPIQSLKQFLARPLLRDLQQEINPQRFNGASLLGLQGSIVKSHGNATQEGFSYAIRQAIQEVENQVPYLIAEKVAAIMGQR